MRSILARGDDLVVPLDVELGVEVQDRVVERERRLGSQLAGGRRVEAVTEEEDAVGLDVHDARLGAMVAAHVPYLDRDLAEVELEPVLKDDVGRSDLDAARRRQLRLDVRSVVGRCLAGPNARVESLVAPVRRGQLAQLLCRRRMSDDQSAERGPAEDVIPVRVCVDHGARRRDSLCRQRLQEQPCVSLRRTGVEHQRAPIADHGTQRRPVGLARRQPVDVLGDPRQRVHLSGWRIHI